MIAFLRAAALVVIAGTMIGLNTFSLHAGLPPLIPREILLGNPRRTNPAISPDGRYFAWLAPDTRGVLQVRVQTRGKSDSRTVTSAPRRSIGNYFWAWDSKTILYDQDSDGDENWHTFATDITNGRVRDLTPWQGVRGEVVASNPKFPEQILVALNLHNRRLNDVYRVNIRSGAVELDTTNPGDVADWLADDNMLVRAAVIVTPDGGTEIRVRDSARARWRTLIKAAMEDSLNPLDFSKDGRSIFLESSIRWDTRHVVAYEIASGRETEIAGNGQVDAGPVLMHPTRHVVQAVAFSLDRTRWTVIDPAVRLDFDRLARLADGDLTIISRDLADKTWLVAFNSDRAPLRYYLWDRRLQKGTFLFSQHPELDKQALAAMKPITFRARDGMQLHGYLTLPVGLAPKNLPMVVYVHGGPWWRDFRGYDGVVQLLANRGYVLMQINFRGSDGYGKKYLHAGDRQWGVKMESDLIDGLQWAVRQNIADRDRVAIYGGSYGGYAALAGAAFFPNAFRCAIDEFGPSSLFTLMASMPPYWEAEKQLFYTRIADPAKPQDRAYLTEASPLFAAHKIRIPMLIGQGANDVRVTARQSEQIVAAIKSNHGQVIYVRYTDEGHGFVRSENRLDFQARAEKFLADNLGGRYEPMDAARIPGSTAIVTMIGGAGTRLSNQAPFAAQ